MGTSTKGANGSLDLKKLQTDLQKSTTLLSDFKEAVQKSIGISIDEFTALRKNMLELGVSVGEIEKLNLKVQESYNEEIKKLQELKEEALKAGTERERTILTNYMNEYIKLTDHGRKEADPEKYKALLKQK